MSLHVRLVMPHEISALYIFFECDLSPDVSHDLNFDEGATSHIIRVMRTRCGCFIANYMMVMICSSDN
jgi:hypothetical protein